MSSAKDFFPMDTRRTEEAFRPMLLQRIGGAVHPRSPTILFHLVLSVQVTQAEMLIYHIKLERKLLGRKNNSHHSSDNVLMKGGSPEREKSTFCISEQPQWSIPGKIQWLCQGCCPNHCDYFRLQSKWLCKAPGYCTSSWSEQEQDLFGLLTFASESTGQSSVRAEKKNQHSLTRAMLSYIHLRSIF